jgi:hypothetical protein
MRARWHKLRTWWVAIPVAVAIGALSIGVAVDSECEATKVTSAVELQATKVATAVADRAPFTAVRLDCHEQPHEAPLPEPTRFDPTQTVTAGGTITATSRNVLGYHGGAILPEDVGA